MSAAAIYVAAGFLAMLIGFAVLHFSLREARRTLILLTEVRARIDDPLPIGHGTCAASAGLIPLAPRAGGTFDERAGDGEAKELVCGGKAAAVHEGCIAA